VNTSSYDPLPLANTLTNKKKNLFKSPGSNPYTAMKGAIGGSNFMLNEVSEFSQREGAEDGNKHNMSFESEEDPDGSARKHAVNSMQWQSKLSSGLKPPKVRIPNMISA